LLGWSAACRDSRAWEKVGARKAFDSTLEPFPEEEVNVEPQCKYLLRGPIVAQFTGVLNSTALKWFIALLAVDRLKAAGTNLDTLQQTQETIAFVVFTLPFVLISLPAGVLADRWSKRTVLVTTKAVEFGLLTAVSAALYFHPAGGAELWVLLGLIGVQSAAFSPAFYGILPEILPHEKLSSGNGLAAMWGFLALIAGTGAASILLDLTRGGPVFLAGLVFAALAAAGYFAARTAPRVAPARTEGGITTTLLTAWSTVRADRFLWLTVVGLSFYWTNVSLVGQDIPVYARGVLPPDNPWGNTLATLPLLFLAVGTAAGSVLVGWLSSAKVEVGFIPLGAGGITLCTLLLGTLAPGLAATLVLMTLLGISSGFVAVPLNAMLQWRAPADRRGAVIALSNSLTFTGILAGSLIGGALAQAAFNSRAILIWAGLLTFAGTAWAVYLLPEALLRLVLVLLTHTFYRLRVYGREHVPQEGGALLTPNHVTFVDALFLIASLDRPVHFIVADAYFNHWLLRLFMKALRAIPYSAAAGPRIMLRAFKEAGACLDNGELVCVFPEGQLTRTGMLQPFQRGLERIVEGRSAPIIPVNMDRVWGSIFSRAGGRFLTRIPERIPYPVVVSFGKPLSAETSFVAIRQAVSELSEASWTHRKADRPPLHRTFIRQVRHHPFSFAFADVTRPRVSRIGALSGSVALSRSLRSHWEGQPFVGILLPPSITGAVVNLAAVLSGRTSVNLNYTAGQAGMRSAVRQAGLKSVVTSRAFLETAKLEMPEGLAPIWLEDVIPKIGFGGRSIALLLAMFAPVRMLEKACGASRHLSVDDLATVIFSSGSTGEPKGVMLSHFNIDANVEAAAQVLRPEPHDRLLGILPLFHSFGYMSLWLAANHKMGLIFHASPLEGAIIGELVQKYQATILLATPTFLQIYLRRCTPAQFGSLRIVLAGAEKLSDRLAQAFEDAFGIRPLEGYGTTECAPVIAASTLDYRAPGLYQPGSRRGFVGQPLPGVALRIVDPETFEPLPPMTPGMLLVKGPNVMRGYLGRDKLTDEVMRDGWYITGDIALMDEDGFLRITDRLSRFSKIGGEMVPHGRVEDALQEAAGANLQVFAVTAVPDERKGERLVVLHTLDEKMIPGLLEKLAAGELPNLFVPRRDQFVKVEKLPILGTGKLDLRELKRIATEMAGVGPN
jgi:acyl-[acyl-carrier-protein]-phospholipid O-acyltransferase/long-chain-fatty-acid--[acyl-carrier-protein] ligase